MKRILALVMCQLLAISPIITVTAVTGCKTSQQTVAYKTTASVQVAVKSSLSAWADYVVAQRSRIAALPDAQQADESAKLDASENKVRAALARYKQAAEVAHVGVNVALGAGSPPAPAPLLEAGNALVETVTELAK